MDIYSKKQKWKFTLLGFAIIIGVSSIFFTNRLISSLSNSTKTLSKSATSLKSSTNSLESSMKEVEIYISKKEKNETQKVERWARAMNLITTEWDINEKLSNEKKQKTDSAIL